jgi:hypothetical protein
LINFYSWLENLDNEMPSSLSEPEHKQGESNLSLNKLVEKRINELVQEIESKGIGNKNDIMNSISNYLSQTTPDPSTDESPDMNQGQNPNQMDPNQMSQMDPNQMSQMDPNQMSQMDPNQMNQMNPNQMGQM